MVSIETYSKDLFQLFGSDELLLCSQDYKSKRFGEGQASVEVRADSWSSFLADLDASETESRWGFLDRRIFLPIQQFRTLFKYNDSSDTFSGTDDIYDNLGVVSRNVEIRIENALRVNAAAYVDRHDEIKQHILGGIVTHAHNILDARLLTNSTRFSVCEALAHAYTDGLYPFGFEISKRTLHCLLVESRPVNK